MIDSLSSIIFSKNKSLAKEMFSTKIKSMLLKDICLCLDEYNLTHGVVEDLTSVVQDAHLIENGIITSTESEDPNFKWTVANPIKVSGEMTPACIRPARKRSTHSLRLRGTWLFRQGG